MTENLKKFLAEAEKNEELKAKLEALTDKDTAVEKVIEIAAEYGFTLMAEDFEQKNGEELSADELESVAGGMVCILGSSEGPYSRCACAVIGAANGCGCAIVGVK